MPLNRRQQDSLGFDEFLGERPGLIGSALVPEYPFPQTQGQLNNYVQALSAQSAQAQAKQNAINDARYQSDVIDAQIEFDKKTTIGNIARSKIHNLRAAKWMLRENNGVRGIEFNQRGYSAFDGIIVEKVGVDKIGDPISAAFNERNPHYTDFTPLRRNLALLRNEILSQDLFPDGKFIPRVKSAAGAEDLANYKMLNQMAERLGEALASTSGSAPSLPRRWLTTMKNLLTNEDLSSPPTNAFLKAANVPDKGAAEMYNYLLSQHKKWKLKPREQTIFSDDNIRQYSRSSQMLGAIDAYETNVMQELRKPETLKAGAKPVAVTEAQYTLKILRSLMANPVEQERQSQLSDQDLEKSRQILRVAVSFKDAMATITKADPNVMRDNTIVVQTVEAFEQLGYRMKVEGRKMLEQEREPTAAKNLQAVIDKTPQYDTATTTDALLLQVDAGLTEAARLEKVNGVSSTEAANDSSWTQRTAQQKKRGGAYAVGS